MKKRRTVVIAFLLAAIMVIGVGYAALATDLSINGTATTALDTSDLKVYFSDATHEKTNTNLTAEVPTAPGVGVTSLTYNVGNFKSLTDKVTTTFTITNDSEFDVTLTEPAVTINKGSEYFNIIPGTLSATTIAKGETATFTVEVSLKEVYAQVLTATFTVEVTATGVTATTPTND